MQLSFFTYLRAQKRTVVKSTGFESTIFRIRSCGAGWPAVHGWPTCIQAERTWQGISVSFSVQGLTYFFTVLVAGLYGVSISSLSLSIISRTALACCPKGAYSRYLFSDSFVPAGTTYFLSSTWPWPNRTMALT